MANKSKKKGKKAKKVPAGMHMMPNGKMMKDSEMKGMSKKMDVSISRGRKMY